MAESTGARQAKIGGTENEASRDTVSNLKENVKNKASEVGQRVSEAIEEKKTAAADALSDTASKLHESARNFPGGERVSSVAHRAADTIEQTSHYIREHDTTTMMQDVGDFVKRYPTQAIVGAAVLGFLAGRMFARD